MSDMIVLTEQMVLDIAAQAYRLDDLRLRMFLKWLASHSGRVKIAAEDVIEMDVTALRGADRQEVFKAALRTWLESLPVKGLLWEYQTVITEICWWRNLDPIRLQAMVDSEN